MPAKSSKTIWNDVSFTTYEESVESVSYFSVQYGDCVIEFSSSLYKHAYD